NGEAIALNAGRQSRKEAPDNALWPGPVHRTFRRGKDAVLLILDGTELTDRPGGRQPEWVGASSCDQDNYQGGTQPQIP
ncbi:MAG: hypothetical protein M3028_07555, partial [Bifidobacterium sp.]|nr:hypothetical protein [Bifidobacterium sp.]